MSYRDDEEINVSAGTMPEGGVIELKVINNPEAPLEEGKLKVMIELTGSGCARDRGGLDLVVVLDVSESMGNEKVGKMKAAMGFVIDKLGPNDRLSVITFKNIATRLCPLRRMTKQAQAEIKSQVNALESSGKTNILHANDVALHTVLERRYGFRRTTAIMIMSDGVETIGKIRPGNDRMNIPVFTFGIGADQSPTVLTMLALETDGGTFSDVQKHDDLSAAVAQCLAGLLTNNVLYLRLTVKSINSKIVKVRAGNYTQKTAKDSVTVVFGHLFIKEVRRVIVELLLPAAAGQMVSADVLEITYTYLSTGEQVYNSVPRTVGVCRTREAMRREREETVFEENRIQIAEMIREARILADDNKLTDATKKISDAQKLLENIKAVKSNSTIEMLKYELKTLADTMQSAHVYIKQGRPFALCSEISHGFQRYAARGDLNYLRLFATPRMGKYLEQVQEYEKDTSKPVPKEEDDLKQDELVADPSAAIVEALTYNIRMAIQSLRAIEKILNNPKNV